jgi:hypothetical protein
VLSTLYSTRKQLSGERQIKFPSEPIPLHFHTFSAIFIVLAEMHDLAVALRQAEARTKWDGIPRILSWRIVIAE